MNNTMKIAREEVRDAAGRQWADSAELRAEFGNDFDKYLAFRAAEAAGRVKMLKNQVRANA